MASLLDTLTTKLTFLVDDTPLKKFTTSMSENAVATDKAAASVGFFEKEIGNLKATVTGFLGAFIGFEAIMKVINAANTLDQALAQIDAALKSTGDASGYTKKQLVDMAETLQSSSTFDKGDILRNLTTTLLQFTNVSGQTFSRAQQDIIDYAARSGTDLNSATRQIGRALDNPARALLMLTRIGITFSESQQKVIESLAKTGHLAQAQTMILDALEKKFSGSAEAAEKAGKGPLLQFMNNLNDLAEVIGNLILDAIDPLVNKLNEWYEDAKHYPVFVEILASAFSILGTALLIYSTRAKIAALATGLLDVALSPLTWTILALIAAVIAISFVIQDVWVYFKGGKSIIGELIQWIDKLIDKIKGDLVGAFDHLKQIFADVWNYIKGGLDDISKGFDKIKGLFSDSSMGSHDIIASGAPVGGSLTSSTSSSNTTIAPVNNINLTMHGVQGSPDDIAQAVTQHLGTHLKNTARSFDSRVKA